MSIEIVPLHPDAEGALFDGALAVRAAVEAEVDPQRPPINAAWFRSDLRSTDDFVNVAAIDYPSCAVTRIFDYTNDSSVLPASATVERHCEIPCTTDADCPAMEVCASVVGGGMPRDICVLDRP